MDRGLKVIFVLSFLFWAAVAAAAYYAYRFVDGDIANLPFKLESAFMSYESVQTSPAGLSPDRRRFVFVFSKKEQFEEAEGAVLMLDLVGGSVVRLAEGDYMGDPLWIDDDTVVFRSFSPFSPSPPSPDELVSFDTKTMSRTVLKVAAEESRYFRGFNYTAVPGEGKIVFESFDYSESDEEEGGDDGDDGGEYEDGEYDYEEYSSGLYVFDVETGGEVEIWQALGDSGDLAWRLSPAGDEVAILDGGAIHALSLASGKSRVLINRENGGDSGEDDGGTDIVAFDYAPPLLVFLRRTYGDEGGGEGGIVEEELTEDDGEDEGEEESKDRDTIWIKNLEDGTEKMVVESKGCGDLRWSPGRGHIAYTKECGRESWVYDVGNGTNVRIGDGGTALWLSDEELLVNKGGSELWRVSRDGTKNEQLFPVPNP
ncbi:MAG: hypothetical protein V3W31_04965 [Thermodesulfobacteriota bacterium]